jgi:hypothetical protein
MSGDFNITTGLQAVQYDLRMTSAKVTTNSANNQSVYTQNTYIWLYSGPLSGGTAVNLVPFRDGSPAATALMRHGCTLSGTQTVLIDGTDSGSESLGGSFDWIIQAGHTLAFNGLISGSGTATSWYEVDVTFEELRLSWHY